MEAAVIVEERNFIACLECGKHRFSIPVLDFKSTIHFCIECGSGYAIHRECGVVWIDKTEQFGHRSLVFLKYENMVLVVEGSVINGNVDDDEAFYNLQLCPTTYFKAAIAVIDVQDRDADPHGIFEHITTVVLTPEDYAIFEAEELDIEQVEKVTGLQFDEM